MKRCVEEAAWVDEKSDSESSNEEESSVLNELQNEYEGLKEVSRLSTLILLEVLSQSQILLSSEPRQLELYKELQRLATEWGWRLQ